MIRNYLKITFRNIRRNKLYALVNLSGLALGIASFLFIGLYIYNEMSYDRFWVNSDRIYRVDGVWISPEGSSRYATAPPPLAGRMEADMPEVKFATRILKWSDFTFRPETDMEQIFRETNVYIADQNYFRVFSERLTQGNPETALNEPLSIVLSESAARRYFGQEVFERESLIGKQILGGKDAGTPWKITGIMKDLPVNTHQDFEMIVSMWGEFKENQNWAWNIMHTYILLNDEMPLAQAENSIYKRLEEVIENYTVPYLGGTSETSGSVVEYLLMPIQDIHLYSDYLREMKANGSITTVYIFGLVAILILIVACVNFTNLTTALSIKRAKEVGVHKVLGSNATGLSFKFLAEAIMYSLLATLVALTTVELFVLYATPKLGITLAVGIFDQSVFIVGILLISLVTGVLAGFYPAWLIARYKPSDVLKGNIYISSTGFQVRNYLVVFQFMASVGLIMATGVISDQMDYLRNSKLGFEKENILVIQNDREIDEERTRLKEILSQHPEILSISFSTGIPALDQFMVRDYSVEGDNGALGLRWFEIDDDFVNTMNLKLIDGRNFQANIPSDSMGIILNEKAVEELALAEPVGKEITINKGADDERTVHVIAVVQDFHFESMHNEVKPLGMEFLRGYSIKDYISVKMAPGKTEKAIDQIKEAWHTLEPQVPITYSFLDSDFDALYNSEKQLESVFNIFSALSMIIAGLGLFGLATYVAQQRKKEIGIRKLLGASVSNLIFVLLKNFSILALIGLVLATVVISVGAETWLSSFAYRTNFGFEQFLSALIATGGILVVSVLHQVYKTAMSNPVDSIKNE
ncbi:MAG: ABC transporter permease [Bacteroidota bacterium]